MRSCVISQLIVFCNATLEKQTKWLTGSCAELQCIPKIILKKKERKKKASDVVLNLEGFVPVPYNALSATLQIRHIYASAVRPIPVLRINGCVTFYRMAESPD